MAFHPIGVALKCVDLTIMCQHAKRLRQPPLREGIGGIPLMIQSKGRLKPIVFQIRVELRHILGQEHAFVDDRTAREARQIQAINACRESCFFNPAANNIELTLKNIFTHAF